MAFFDVLVDGFDKAVGAAAMGVENGRQTRQRELAAKNLEQLSITSRVTSIGSIALAFLAAALIATSGTGFVIAGGIILAAAFCSAVISYDLAEVAQNASHKLTDERSYGKALRTSDEDLVDELFQETIILDKFLPAQMKSDLTHDLIRV